MNKSLWNGISRFEVAGLAFLFIAHEIHLSSLRPDNNGHLEPSDVADTDSHEAEAISFLSHHEEKDHQDRFGGTFKEIEFVQLNLRVCDETHTSQTRWPSDWKGSPRNARKHMPQEHRSRGSPNVGTTSLP
jgi:hypothetical protein